MVDDFVEFAVGHGPCARHKVEPSKTKSIHKARGLMCGIRPPLERCSIIKVSIFRRCRAQTSNLGKFLRLWNYLVCILAEILLWLEEFSGHDDD